jgi:hypothetical protein
VRAKRIAVLLGVVALLASGCSKKEYDSEKVRGFVDATTPHSYRLAYEVTEGDVTVQVQGIVEDDFRYKLQLALDGDPAAEEVVVDDAVALRFLDPKLVDDFTDPEVQGKVDTDTDVKGADVFDALGARRWVLDPAGAPSAAVNLNDTGKDPDAPRDPLFDARTALAYVRSVAQSNSAYFVRYDPESIEPTYRRDEDPFPAPSKDSGVVRYDSKISDLPSASAATSGTRTLPSAASFRKMAVYVKDGVVIAVREFIGMSPRQRDDLIEYSTAVLQSTANDDVVASFRSAVDGLRDDPDQLDQFLLGGLNTFITSTGAPPIRFRTMSLQISDLDAVTSTVDLPHDVITGDLAVMRNLGRKPIDDDGSSDAVATKP